MVVRRECESRAFEFFLGLEAEGIAEPADHVAALAQRAGEHIAAAIDAVDKGPPGHGQVRAVEQDAQGARGPDGRAGPARTDAAGADVRQPTVAEREIPGDIAQLRPAAGKARAERARRLIPIAERRQLRRSDAGEAQRGVIPPAAIDIEQPRPRCDRMTDPDVTVELLVEVFAQRDPAYGATDGTAASGAKPADLRRPVAGV